MKSLVVLSGGQDSTTCLYWALKHFDEVRALIAATPGVVLQDDPAHNLYPMPITAHHKDEVFVGRLRRDPSQPRTLNLWVVADNIRKGAATNAVQIMESLINSQS